MHRDVKPENILANLQGEVKLADFGVCWHRPSCADLNGHLQMAETPVGTRRYMSPERCAMQSYSFVADIWSVGVVLFDLASGKNPFGHVKTVLELHDELTEKEPPQLDTELHEPDLIDFVTLCLKKDASQRPSASALLEHRFIANGLERRSALGAWIMQARTEAQEGEGLIEIPCLQGLQASANGEDGSGSDSEDSDSTASHGVDASSVPCIDTRRRGSNSIHSRRGSERLNVVPEHAVSEDPSFVAMDLNQEVPSAR